MFEQALRRKLRFESVRGLVTVEDLYDIPLTTKNGFSLDDIAKNIARQIKQEEENSFVIKRSKSNNDNELRLEIVKHVIKVKIEEEELRKNAKIEAIKRNKIARILQKKEDEELEGLSKEELIKMLD